MPVLDERRYPFNANVQRVGVARVEIDQAGPSFGA
jgi:hypothetical protein